MNSGSEQILFSESGQFSRLFLDYVSAHEQLKPFYAFSPDEDGYRKAAAAIQYQETNRALLTEAIRRQYESSETALPAELFAALAAPGTLTVTTGHQLCLFTGPLYFIIKIATTIRLAEKMQSVTGKKIVPVYWMASEDHDFDEIASVNLFGKKISWEKPGNGAVGKLKTDSLQPVLAELKTILGEAPGAAELSEWLSDIYRPGRNLAQATRSLVHRLFGKNILCLDGDDAGLKKLAHEIFSRDLHSGIAYRSVMKSIAELESIGYGAQVKPREINLFYTGENFRERIEKEGGNFRVLNTDLVFTPEQLDAELKNNPAAFSPNVVLRPLYQQLILPNLAYAGGPGELAYWLEYRELFEELNVFFPVLQPRSFMLLIDQASQRKLEKLGLHPADLFTEIEDLIRRFVSERAGAELNFDSEKKSLEEIYSRIISKAEASDPTLRKTAEAELQKSLNSLDALLGKMVRAQKQKQETDVNQLRKLHASFFPEGILMERYANFIPYWLKTNGELIAMIGSKIEFPVKGITILPV